MATVTLKDIALALDVSVMTVSKVMRNRPGVKQDTRNRVLAKAKELNYRPNLTARGLVTGQSRQVGIIVPTLLHPFFAEVLEALSSTLMRAGYALMISSSMEDSAVEEETIERHLGHRLDGQIIASCSVSTAKFKQLNEQGVPFVLIDRYFPGFKTNYVGVDDVAVGRIATEHLIEMGCTWLLRTEYSQKCGEQECARGHVSKMDSGAGITQQNRELKMPAKIGVNYCIDITK
jgi:LacI family transcriptional regulator